jgi:hypothetical protein
VVNNSPIYLRVKASRLEKALASRGPGKKPHRAPAKRPTGQWCAPAAPAMFRPVLPGVPVWQESNREPGSLQRVMTEGKPRGGILSTLGLYCFEWPSAHLPIFGW